MNKIQVQILWWGFFIALAALLIGGKVLLFPAEKGGSQPVVIVAQDYEASVVALELAAESVKEKSLAKDEAVKNEEALSLKPDEEDNEAKRKQRKDAKETRRKAERDLAAARQTLESLQRRSSVSVAPWLRYVIFGVMALVSTLALWYGIAYQGLLNSLANVSIARGLITFVITIVSIAFGLIVILSAVVLDPPDLEEHFRAGKDVLTIFVGILGTIVGYYFGHNSESKADNPDASESLSLSKPVFGILNLNFGAGITNTTLTATITGGTGPYTYSIGFFGPSSHPTPITNIPPALSEDGKIACQVNLPAGIGTLTPVSFSITVQDAAGHFQAFSYGPSFGLTVK